MSLIRKKKSIFAEENSDNNLFVGDICARSGFFSAGRPAAELAQVRYWPGEWFTQSGVLIAWPHKGTDWAYILPEVEETYVRLSFAIAMREPLLIVAADCEHVAQLLSQRLPWQALGRIAVVSVPFNDTWVRDSAPLTIVRGNELLLIDYRFNGWGGKFEAEQDDCLGRHLAELNLFNARRVDGHDFVLEGGSIESDGEGTVLTTASCLLSPSRNPQLSKEAIAQRLEHDLGSTRVLWLEHGHLAGDDTDGHIDTLARFCPAGVIAYTQCLDPTDEHFAELHAMEQELTALRRPDGRPYTLQPLPLPAAVYADVQSGATVTAEHKKEPHVERLPATYANFLILNKAVLVPTYRQPEADGRALAALRHVFPEHEIIGIDCLPLIKQHGSLHCATMQWPRGVLNEQNFNHYLISRK